MIKIVESPNSNKRLLVFPDLEYHWNTHHSYLSEGVIALILKNFNIFFSELDTYEDRVSEVYSLCVQLPEPNKHMLEQLLRHLEKVALNSEKNMMSVSNLGNI